MTRKTGTVFERTKVNFGCLFFNMKHHLCFTIGIDGNDTWAIEYKPEPSGSPRWKGVGFCPIWWAVHHPANEVALPDPEELKQILIRTITRCFEKTLSLGLDAAPEMNGNPASRVYS